MACADVMEDVTGDFTGDFIEIPKNPAFLSRQANVSNELRKDKELTDFTIISQDQRFPCHSAILASSSPWFLAMFRAAMKESTKREVELPTVSPDVVKLILEYIYMGTVRVPCDLVIDTINASNYLELPELKDDCLQRVHPLMKTSNVIPWYKLGHELNIDELKERCTGLLSSSLADIIKDKEIHKLSLDELTSYLEAIKESNVDNDDKLDAVLAWVADDSELHEERKTNTEELVQHVDLLRCSVQCIQEALENSDNDMRLIFGNSLATIAKQSTVRRERSLGRRITFCIVAGHVSKCWRVDESKTLRVLCHGFPCTKWYSACTVPLGFFLTGGGGTFHCRMFDASTQSWIQLTSLKAKMFRYGHASIYLNGKVFVLAGVTEWRPWTQWSKSCQSVLLDGGDWMNEPDLPVAMMQPEVAPVEHNIFALDMMTNKLLCFNTQTKMWINKATCPGEGNIGPRMISVNNQLLVAGGGSVKYCARYTPATDSWITCTRPTLQHHLGALACHDAKIYLMGGKDTKRVEEYDQVSDAWSVCDWELPEQVQNIQAVLVDAP